MSILTAIEASTMPHVLKLTALNTFVIEEMTLAQRVVGDENSNPEPSFIGKQLSNLFLFKDRLGFLCEDHVIMSEAGLGVIENNILHYEHQDVIFSLHIFPSYYDELMVYLVIDKPDLYYLKQLSY